MGTSARRPMMLPLARGDGEIINAGDTNRGHLPRHAFTLSRIFHEFEMFIGKASGAQLYDCYRKLLITLPMGISGAPAG
jgi:hypothetical protein